MDSTSEIGPTRALARWAVELEPASISPDARTWARHGVLDWLGVAIGGAADPLVEILLSDAIEDNQRGESTLCGRAERINPTSAALINGSASHALDFDDVNTLMPGHPSVAVLPAVLALAEPRDASGADVIDAYIVGYEVACRVGEMIGLSHYQRGWHATATIGTFGAAAAAARLLGLDAERAAMALGLAATQAAGLKSMFGTMSKPLHAGRAAMNGLLAARWAARGFTSNPTALEAHQGFAATQSEGFEARPVRSDRQAPFAIESNLFKYHAACYLTHSSIEAVRALRATEGFDVANVARVRTRVARGHLDVCNIAEPRTGLEVKFSIRHVIAMALAGVDTGDRTLYTDETARRADLAAIRERVVVDATAETFRYAAEVTVELRDGKILTKHVDVGIPAKDLAAQQEKLTAKFARLVEPVLGDAAVQAVVDGVAALDEAPSIGALLATTTRSSREEG